MTNFEISIFQKMPAAAVLRLRPKILAVTRGTVQTHKNSRKKSKTWTPLRFLNLHLISIFTWHDSDLQDFPKNMPYCLVDSL